MLRLICFAILAGLVACADTPDGAGPPPHEDRPNIVLILADDLGYGDLGSYGQAHIRTPHLDRMAAEGMRFTQFYAGSTICAPSRAVLMTGLHTGRARVRGNAHAGAGVPLEPEDVTLAEVLREAGYATGMFGKWGLGEAETSGAPNRQGFDAFMGYLNQVHAHFYYVDYLWTIEAGEMRRLPVDSTVYSQEHIVRGALDFIDANRDRPFFLYLPFTLPHAELLAPDSSFAPYLDDAGRSRFPETPYPGAHYAAQPMPYAAYAAMVSHLDRDVGRILDRLARWGLDERTLVLFTSDNGPHEAGGYDPTFFDGNGPLRGIKRDLYEGGIRVPLIARWPGRVPAGTVSDHIGYAGDFFATAADLAGAELPDSLRLDSITLLPALHGEPERQDGHPYLYWEFYERGTAQAVRAGRWKALRQPLFTGPIELYDLETDPGETTDIAAQQPGEVERLRGIMEAAHTPSPVWTVE